MTPTQSQSQLEHVSFSYPPRPNPPQQKVHSEPIAIIGAGPVGLLTAHILIRDGFSNVRIITRDGGVGGVWLEERVYPSMMLNSIHAQFQFSHHPLPLPPNAHSTGGRLTGTDVSTYLQSFAHTFLEGKIRFWCSVDQIHRGEGEGWVIKTHDVRTGTKEEMYVRRVVLCTGGNSTPNIPPPLSPLSASHAGFEGPIVHSSESFKRFDEILHSSTQGNNPGRVVVVGGGKSAQDISAYLANKKIPTTIVYEKADMFLAVRKPLPKAVRQSRLTSILAPAIELRTPVERFLHTTWLGSKIVKRTWDSFPRKSFKQYNIPPTSPLRIAHSLYWAPRASDEGVKREDSFQALVVGGRIEVLAPVRVEGYVGVGVGNGEEGEGEKKGTGGKVRLSDGRTIEACAVVLATGYRSSWDGLFDEETANDIGLSEVPTLLSLDEWDGYKSLANPPRGGLTREKEKEKEKEKEGEGEGEWVDIIPIYRGLVPAKSIERRDIAVNGATLSANTTYSWEVSAHWISSYFLGDTMRLPETPEEAMKDAGRNAAWMRKRFPGVVWRNSSWACAAPHFGWAQATDQLLEDMYLPSMRSGGNWLTWPFKVVSISELATLGEERRVKRVEEEERRRIMVREVELEEGGRKRGEGGGDDDGGGT